MNRLWETYVRYTPNYKNYQVKVTISKPSPYGDNLEEDISSEILK